MVKSLNVAFSVTYIPPTYIGGGQTYIYYLTRELYNLGVKIDVFASEVSVESSEWDWEHAKIHECKSILRVSNTPIMPTLPLKMGKDNSCDLIHTDVPQGFSCDISAFISDVKKKPLIITYHCDLLPSTISRAYSFILRNYTLKRADKIVATTRTYAETSPALTLKGREATNCVSNTSACTNAKPMAVLPTNIPSPGRRREVVSTQTRSLSGMLCMVRIFAFVIAISKVESKSFFKSFYLS